MVSGQNRFEYFQYLPRDLQFYIFYLSGYRQRWPQKDWEVFCYYDFAWQRFTKPEIEAIWYQDSEIDRLKKAFVKNLLESL